MSHTLFEINEFIRRVIALNLPQALWVRAELADVKVSKGHYYLDLVQKNENSEEIIAQGQAVIWAQSYRSLHRKIGADLSMLLQPGMEILFLAKVEFHERFGLKLMVEDIDPSHTIGKLEMQRRETIRKLQAMDLLEKNGLLKLPIVLQKIAVLSSEKAAGYQDFIKHLSENSFGYRFKMEFFPVAVQGVMVEKEVLNQLQSIEKRHSEFDIVVIIRGGGARLDLSAFDSFILARAVAEMPLPVLTGIGHEVDETVLDLVAHTSLKTPTAVADYILQRNLDFESQVLNRVLEVKNLALQAMKTQSNRLQHISQMIDFQVRSSFKQQSQMLDYIEKEVPVILKNRFALEKQQLVSLEKLIKLLGPGAALQRGFAIVFKEGKQISSVEKMNAGDELQIQMRDGKAISTVKKLEP